MPNPVVHFEIGCKDTQASARFYNALFGWSTHQQGAAQIPARRKGFKAISLHWATSPYHYTMFYVKVEDISASLARAEQLGKVVVPKVDIPGYGSFARFTDPDGNMVGMWKPIL